jgi:uncharacterized protein (TIGR02117 family)
MLAALVMVLLLALVLGALWPQNRGWQEAAEGVTIFVDGTPSHTELILPVAAAGHDWRGRIAAEAFPDGGHPEAYLSFSWGERDFFLSTPSWADFRLSAGLRALFMGEETLIHVYRIDWMPAAAPVRLSEDQYRRLVAHIEAQFARSNEVLAGYGPNDAFFPARGRYTPWRTCNQWTRDALAAAGVRVGRWTPLSQSLMWRFRREEETS